jgi:DHA2 family multidrug resistance protein
MAIPDSASATPREKWLVTLAVLTGTIMAVLDSSIVNVALPKMSGTLACSIEEITWVVTAYLLSNVIIMRWWRRPSVRRSAAG